MQMKVGRGRRGEATVNKKNKLYFIWLELIENLANGKRLNERQSWIRYFSVLAFFAAAFISAPSARLFFAISIYPNCVLDGLKPEAVIKKVKAMK